MPLALPLRKRLAATGRPSAVTPLLPFLPSSEDLTEPPCLVMLGGLGDVLIALTIAWHYAQRFQTPTPFLTSAKYQNVLSGCSYVKSVGYDGQKWNGYQQGIAWAKDHFRTVYPLHVGDSEICQHPRTTRFCHEQYLHARVPGRYGEFPLVFDRRNEKREAALVKRIRDGRALFLYNLTGRSSPFRNADALLESLTSQWPQVQFVNVSKLDLSHYQDLLGLLDVSIGALSIDTSTIHIMPASRAPYIALVNDTKTPWWSSVPRGNCVLELGYTQTMKNLLAIHSAIQKMLAASGEAVTVTPPVVASPYSAPSSLPTVAVSTLPAIKPHLVTLACNGMESVWKVAKRTWEPWCRARRLSIETNTSLVRHEIAPCWNKIPLILAALEKHDVVWWVDSDVTVARKDAELPESNADLLFATDWNGLCAAMFRARATPWTKQFLAAALMLGDVRDHDAFGKGCGIKWEQNTFKLLLREFPACAEHVEFLPANFMCDRPLESRDPTVSFNHFGAMTNIQRIAAMQRKHPFI